MCLWDLGAALTLMSAVRISTVHLPTKPAFQRRVKKWQWIINCYGCERKQAWLKSSFCHAICVEEMRKNMKAVNIITVKVDIRGVDILEYKIKNAWPLSWIKGAILRFYPEDGGSKLVWRLPRVYRLQGFIPAGQDYVTLNEIIIDKDKC
jgi:hypothetical protein